MTNLNTIKDCNELAAQRLSEMFKSGDDDKISKCMELSYKAADYIIHNYPSMEVVVNDYDLWKAMCRDVNRNSFDMLSLLLTEEEMQKFNSLLNNEVALFSYWKEVIGELKGLECAIDAELKQCQEALQGVVDNL